MDAATPEGLVTGLQCSSFGVQRILENLDTEA